MSLCYTEAAESEGLDYRPTLALPYIKTGPQIPGCSLIRLDARQGLVEGQAVALPHPQKGRR